MTPETHDLRNAAPGTTRRLTCLRYGVGGPGPVVYLQAGLHADEMPGMLVLHHLMPLLAAAETEGRLLGEVRVVPVANPIGLSQWAFQRPLGRQEAETMHNFNRGYADLAALTGDRLGVLLGPDQAANRDTIRAMFRTVLAEERGKARTEMLEMQATLLHWSCDADIVLDLHCDHFAVLHFYTSPARPEVTSALVRAIGAKLVLVETVSGGHAFDEAHTAPWHHLRQRFGDRFPIPAPCFAATLEYRGQFDVDDASATIDAHNLLTFLAQVGVLTGWPDAPAHADVATLPLSGAAEVFAPQAGIVTWTVAPGAHVAQGALIAHVTDAMTQTRLPVTAPVAGMLFRQDLWRSCLRGASLAHVAGETPVRSGNLLSD